VGYRRGTGGNESVFGLIDWDGKKMPTLRIHVLCHGLREGLETALLDPLLVVAALARASAESARTMGANKTYQSLPSWDHQRWQFAVDKLQIGLSIPLTRLSSVPSKCISSLHTENVIVRPAPLL
jgi:hypothetical protein